MGKPKKYDRRTICFGPVGHPARLLAAEIVKKAGKKALSEYVRKAMIVTYSERPEFQQYKNVADLIEYKELKRKCARSNERLAGLRDHLFSVGYNEEDLLG